MNAQIANAVNTLTTAGAVIVPASTHTAPVVILLPEALRYCAACHQLKDPKEMRTPDHCKACHA
jgi:hypothetical protein